MWNEIVNNADVKNFMETVSGFHDSCIKEIKYVSGAYVDDRHFMYPVNNKRKLSIIIQRQTSINSTIELEFRKLKHLKLIPLDETYTCEILDSTLLLHEGFFYWCDCGGLTINKILLYEGTVVCAEALRWRSINDKGQGGRFA